MLGCMNCGLVMVLLKSNINKKFFSDCDQEAENIYDYREYHDLKIQGLIFTSLTTLGRMWFGTVL